MGSSFSTKGGRCTSTHITRLRGQKRCGPRETGQRVFWAPLVFTKCSLPVTDRSPIDPFGRDPGPTPPLDRLVDAAPTGAPAERRHAPAGPRDPDSARDWTNSPDSAPDNSS